MEGITKKESGQVLLITLLVLSLAITVVLSIIGRTTNDVSISNQIAESSRAFSAAEAGIEEALKTGLSPGTQILSSGASFQATVNNIGGDTGIYEFTGQTTEDQTATLWLVNHNADGTLAEVPTYTAATLDVCWGTGVITPAMIISIFYKSSGVYKVAREAVDPDNVRRGTNNFAGPTASTGGCGAGSNTTYKKTLTFANFSPSINPASDILLVVRMVPVYAGTHIVINSPSPQVIPLQGNKIESSGSTNSGTTRKIVVFQQFRSPAPVFDNVIYSEGSFGH